MHARTHSHTQRESHFLGVGNEHKWKFSIRARICTKTLVKVFLFIALGSESTACSMDGPAVHLISCRESAMPWK